MKVIILLILIIISICIFIPSYLKGGITNFYNIKKNKKCKYNTIIKRNTSPTINNCITQCFKNDDCLCMSYNFQTKNCEISNTDNTENSNPNHCFIKKI